MAVDTDTRALAERLKAFIEGDLSLAEEIYAEDAITWHNNDGIEISRAEIVARTDALAGATETLIEINQHFPTAEGFVQTQTNNFTLKDGSTVSFVSALFVTLDDSGLIKRVDGYVDGAALAPLAAAFG
jgi:hypothetical protein